MNAQDRLNAALVKLLEIAEDLEMCAVDGFGIPSVDLSNFHSSSASRDLLAELLELTREWEALCQQEYGGENMDLSEFETLILELGGVDG